MIKKGINKIVALVSGLLFSMFLSAQDLPLLPADQAVKTERFPNGMTCYVAANPYIKGIADYAVVRRSDRAVVLRRSNSLTINQQHADSVLLGMVSTVAASGMPADYAVFACGDVDVQSVIDKLRYMSFMIPAGDVPEDSGYQAGELSEVSFSEMNDTLSGRSVVVAGWMSPRTPEPMMNTVQKAVYDKAVYELGFIVRERMRKLMADAGMPAGDVLMSHRGSHEGPEAECFRFSVEVPTPYAALTGSLLEEVLEGIDAHGADAAELCLAEAAYLTELSARAEDRSNEAYLDRCISAYLYNSSLISPDGLIEFHRSKEVSDKLREQVFAGISAALLDIRSEDAPEPVTRTVSLHDTLSFTVPLVKTSLRSSRKDHLSGGVVWTFYNGFKVVFKKMPTNGETYFSLAVNGGYGSVKGYAGDGEEYLSSYLESCSISGLKPDYFVDMLQLAGVTMTAEVNYSNTIIKGKTSNDKTGLMMKALLAAANERSSSDQLFDDISTRMNDGVLVIVSDMEENRLRRQLAHYVGGFRTRESALRRVNVNAGYSYRDDSEDDEVLAMSMRLPLTLENCVAADIATFVMQCRLDERLYPLGLRSDISHALRIYPEDRYDVRVTVNTNDGQDAGAEVLREVRIMLDDIVKDGVDHGDVLTAAKAAVKHYRMKEKELPSYWLHAIALRHLDGKDFTTGYEAKADAMTPEKVSSLLRSLDF